MEDFSVAGRHHRSKLRLTALALLIVVVVGGLAWWLWPSSDQPKTEPAKISTPKPTNLPSSVAGRYLFHGTTVWSRGVEKDSLRADGSYDYAQPFSGLSTFEPAKYDAWLTSFECPITNNTVPFATQVSNLVFNCRPEYLPEAAKYFDFFNLANNHTGDQAGATGLAETRQHMAATPGVQYFGNYDPGVTEDICEVVALPVRVVATDKTETKSDLPVAMCAWHYFMRKPAAGEIEVMKKYADVMPVFAFVEMGVEYQATASATQQDIAHAIMNQGPEFIVANNPHWVQNTEVYMNKLIVYATGNFIFDQLEPEEQRSASLDVDMTINYDQNVSKWLALAKACTKFQDDCLDEATKQGLKKVSPKFKFNVVAGQGGYRHITQRADAATQAAVEQRLNWAQTLSQLGQN